eukprot:scaffold23.g4128.t1
MAKIQRSRSGPRSSVAWFLLWCLAGVISFNVTWMLLHQHVQPAGEGSSRRRPSLSFDDEDGSELAAAAVAADGKAAEASRARAAAAGGMAEFVRRSELEGGKGTGSGGAGGGNGSGAESAGGAGGGGGGDDAGSAQDAGGGDSSAGSSDGGSDGSASDDGGGGGQAAGGAAGSGGGTRDVCHTEKEAEYDGEEVVRWGSSFLLVNAEKCCKACAATPRCNVWVYCAAPGGCGGLRRHRECWLKRALKLDPSQPRGQRGPGVGWVSGAKYTYADAAAASQRLRRQKDDVAIKDRPAGRIEAVLFADVSPRAAENMRIIDQFIDQTGAETESVFGGAFKDDPGGLALKHDRKGLLRRGSKIAAVANVGHNTTTSHFSIMMGPAPHLNAGYVIFGQVVTGFEVLDAINALSRGKKDNTATAADGAVITDAGQLRRGTLKPDLSLGL